MINRFQGFLSNFYPATVTLDGDEYPTVEHAYQAAKTTDPNTRRAIRRTATPGEAKRLGNRLVIRTDWMTIRLDVMENLLRQKFGTFHADLQHRLLLTGDEELVEENTWGDRFWGVYKGQGENHLGRILMQIREELSLGHRENIG